MIMDNHGIPGFINARTDLFLKAGPDEDHASLVEEALVRGAAYTEAGADGFFVPGLKEASLIREICAKSTLPVNVMMSGKTHDIDEVAKLGVSRVSFGPTPYRDAATELEHRARAYY